MDVQQQIKNNAEEVQMFIRDMSNWEKEMKRKEHSLLQCNNIDNDKVTQLKQFLLRTSNFC